MAHTAPVVKDGFSFAGDSLFVEVSNHSRHPRATIPALNVILRPSKPEEYNANDPTAHWWEAQLLHYGLTPSKTKSVAKNRVLDALNKGTLAVPDSLLQLERDLKKQWAKNEKEAMAALKKGKTPATTSTSQAKAMSTSTTTAKKRKMEPDEAATGSTKVKKSKSTIIKSEHGQPTISKSQSAPKGKKYSTKSTTPKVSASDSTAPKPKATPKPKLASSRNAPSTAQPTPARNSAPTSKPRQKQTARKTIGPDAQNPFRHLDPETVNFDVYGEDDEDVGDFIGGRMVARKTVGYDNTPFRHSNSYSGDTPPPSYETAVRASFNSPDRSPQTSQSLGLLNGKYEIECDALREWDVYDDYLFTLDLALSGSSLWGSYDFGMHSGILLIPNRPYRAGASLDFSWRGRENGEGEMSFGERNRGWIHFLGGGEIRGMINCYGEARFTGRRISEGTRPERSAASMRAEWEGYNQREYDRESRARWGGSGW